MKKKYLDGTDWDWVNCYDLYYELENDHHAVVDFKESVNGVRPDYPDSKGLLFEKGNTGYIRATPLYCLSAIYDGMNVKEYYFDIIDRYGFDTKPYFYDLYLDVVVSPELNVYLLDEDELLEARQNDTIDDQLMTKAYDQAEHVMKNLACDEVLHKDVRNRHDKMLGIMRNYQHMIENEGPFKMPLFYERHALRMELSDDCNLAIARQRAMDLFTSCFDSELYVIVNSVNDHHIYESMIHAKSVFKRKCPSYYVEEAMMYQYIYKTDVRNIKIDELISELVSKDFNGKFNEDEVYFLIENEVLMCVYDERGCDIVGDKKILTKLYDTYGEWLLPYDLELMEERMNG